MLKNKYKRRISKLIKKYENKEVENLDNWFKESKIATKNA